MDIELIRSFYCVVEEGSLSRAAGRLRVSQSTLTRQVQTLEQSVGGRLLERTSTGVALTATGHALVEGMKPVLAGFDAALLSARQRALGQQSHVRIGYLPSAAADFLNPALAALRTQHPEVRVQLHDLSPGEQIVALRQGELDLAMLGSEGHGLSQEFHLKTLASLPVVVMLAETHPLAAKATVALKDLRGESFVSTPERDLPGHDRWVERLCRAAGFKPRFMQSADSLAHGLSLALSDNAIGLFPIYVQRAHAPGVVFRRVADPRVKLDLMVAWQRGRTSAAVRTLIAALPAGPCPKED